MSVNSPSSDLNFYSRMAMQDMGGNIRPELAKGCRDCVSTDGISVSGEQGSNRVVLVRIVEHRSALSDGAAKNFRSAERLFPLIIASDQHAGGSVKGASLESSMPHGVIANILMQHGG